MNWNIRAESVRLRPAAPADRSFVERVYFETQRWLIEKLFGWRGDEFERAKFDEFYDERHTQIVQIDGEDVGWLTVLRESNRIEVDSIYIAPERHGGGLGTHLLEQLIAEAEEAQKTLTLSTAKINPALRLYERLGFAAVNESDLKVYMVRYPRTVRGTNFELHRLTPELAASFERMRDAVRAAGEDAWNGHGTEIAWKDVHAYIKATNDWAKGANLPPNWIPTSTYWVVEDGEVVGELEVRHRLLPRLREMGGHIGYHTHPQHRGKGIATFALQQGLRILAAMGTAAALITCSDNNAASARVIEKCGGVRVRDSEVPGFAPRRRYVVPLSGENDFGEFDDLRQRPMG